LEPPSAFATWVYLNLEFVCTLKLGDKRNNPGIPVRITGWNIHLNTEIGQARFQEEITTVLDGVWEVGILFSQTIGSVNFSLMSRIDSFWE
jgi:hypothetical protein